MGTFRKNRQERERGAVALFHPSWTGLLKTPIRSMLYFEDIARLHENRWLARRPNAAGCSGDDHIARLQTHRDADHCDELGDAEDEQVGAPSGITRPFKRA